MTRTKLFIILLAASVFTNAHHAIAADTVPPMEQTQEQQMAPLSVRDAMEQLKVTEGAKEELTITSQDSDSGLSSSYNLKDDNWKLAFAYHVNSHPLTFSDVAGLDFAIGAKMWPRTWLIGYMETAKIRFKAMSEYNQWRDLNTSELENTYETAVLFGLGLSYETSYIQDFLGYEKMFETITASGSFIRIHESYKNENYTGPGIRADYGVHYRFSKAMHLGLKFSYNLFSTKRPEGFVDEPQSIRHLSISWTSVALDFAIYF
ncbi:MAG: hypothetical protein A2X86_19290 [Bdellovibrionales bacterium GWA2_49_15]|nr:MAG: hypothetical protein A2X86_19290 [Bdellovibrionales bacterium GWA2_49_15]HAZ14374.1 hypothetical protein [Bdellovibrionales bacterium]